MLGSFDRPPKRLRPSPFLKWGLVFLLGISLIPGARAGENPVSFVNDIMPILTKSGCNQGICHAKAGGGQNGFPLSLLGFEPADDYESLTRESRGRRVSLAVPEESLLLKKASARIAHRGGMRLNPASREYAMVRDWIAQGMPNDTKTAAAIVRLEIQPGRMSFSKNQSQPLRVLAHYADGKVRDATALALYESNDPSMAEVTDQGLVKLGTFPGKVSIMVRFQGVVGVFQATLPSGEVVKEVPPRNNFIDDFVFQQLRDLGIPPSPPCDDSTFLRRLTLDLAGRLPTLGETRAFLESKHPQKRNQVIEELLKGPDYADHFATKWTAVLKNRRDDSSDLASNFAFHAWVRDSLLANKPYDQFVRELLAATGTVLGNPPVAWYKRVKEPKDQIEDVAQLFLGVRMQCAQCHHHPFERWSQDDYYALAAFFSQVGRKPSGTRGEDLIFHKRGSATAKNIKTGKALPPAALGDSVGTIGPDEDPRLKLADWLKSPQNPFFAKALVNRYWKHFFQKGLIEPEDDIRDSNPPSHPELLAALEKQFVQSGFDLRELCRVIVSSQTYQLSSTPLPANQKDRQNHSRYYPRRLGAEVLLDAIDQLAGTQTDFPNLPPGTRAVALPDNSYNRNIPFLRVFGRPEGESVCECERVQTSSLAQSLHLLNAQDLKSKLSHARGRAESLAIDPRADVEKVKELYLVAFSRLPSPQEETKVREFFAEPRYGPDGKPLDPKRATREAYQDLLWALINTKEFLFNH